MVIMNIEGIGASGKTGSIGFLHLKLVCPAKTSEREFVHIDPSGHKYFQNFCGTMFSLHPNVKT